MLFNKRKLQIRLFFSKLIHIKTSLKYFPFCWLLRHYCNFNFWGFITDLKDVNWYCPIKTNCRFDFVILLLLKLIPVKTNPIKSPIFILVDYCNFLLFFSLIVHLWSVSTHFRSATTKHLRHHKHLHLNNLVFYLFITDLISLFFLFKCSITCHKVCRWNMEQGRIREICTEFLEIQEIEAHNIRFHWIKNLTSTVLYVCKMIHFTRAISKNMERIYFKSYMSKISGVFIFCLLKKWIRLLLIFRSL